MIAFRSRHNLACAQRQRPESGGRFRAVKPGQDGENGDRGETFSQKSCYPLAGPVAETAEKIRRRRHILRLSASHLPWIANRRWLPRSGRPHTLISGMIQNEKGPPKRAFSGIGLFATIFVAPHLNGRQAQRGHTGTRFYCAGPATRTEAVFFFGAGVSAFTVPSSGR